MRLIGLGSGLAAAYKLGGLVLEADKLATSYNRQQVAAVSLAGSQEKLNELLAVYDRVTGGAIDKATALGDVTRLQAIGFADNTEELEKFTTAARGISVAMGQSQDYVISQLTLAIANQSTKRLDQIGLGVSEVEKRIDDLKRADGSLTQEQAYQNAVLGIAVEKYGALAKSAAAQATGQEKAAKAWKDFKLELGEALGPAVSMGLNAVGQEIIDITNYLREARDAAVEAGNAIDKIGGMKPGTTTRTAAGVVGDFVTGGGVGGFNFAQGLAVDAGKWVWQQLQDQFSSEGQLKGQIRGLENMRAGLLAGRADLVNNGGSPAELARQDGLLKQVNDQLAQFNSELRLSSTLSNLPAVLPGFGKSPSYPTSQAAGGFTEDQTKLIVEHQQALNRIEADAAQARQEATAGYEQQRTETIRQYEQTIAREAEDYGRQRARAEQQLQKQLADITAEQKSREAQFAIDLADSIAKITDDGNARISELEHDYQKQRERALEEHNDRLFDAVGSLDAKALAEENRRFARSSKNAEDDFNDRIAKEKEQINQRVQDEIDANDKRIQEGRKNDLQRMADLQESFAEQKAQEDEDRAIRLQRMAEDHTAQLAQMDAAQGQRLAQIDQHAAQERNELNEAFQKQLEEAGIHDDAWLKLQQQFQDESLKSFKDYWEKRVKLDNLALAEIMKPAPNAPKFGPPAPGEKSSFFPGFANGGPVYKTGLALVHQGEWVLNKQQVDSGAVGGARTVNIGDGAIVINAAPNHSAGDIGEAVKGHLMDLIASL